MENARRKRRRKLTRRPDGQVAYTLKFYDEECPELGALYDRCEVRSPHPERNFKQFLLDAAREKFARESGAVSSTQALQTILQEIRAVKHRFSQTNRSTADLDSLEQTLSEQIEGYDLQDF